MSSIKKIAISACCILVIVGFTSCKSALRATMNKSGIGVTAQIDGKDPAGGGGSNTFSLSDYYCKEWAAPVKIGELHEMITEASGFAFPGGAVDHEYVYVSNISAIADGKTQYSNDEYKAIYLAHVTDPEHSATKLKLNYGEFDSPNDVETIMTHACYNDKTKSCLYIVDADDGSIGRSIFVFREPEDFHTLIPSGEGMTFVTKFNLVDPSLALTSKTTTESYKKWTIWGADFAPESATRLTSANGLEISSIGAQVQNTITTTKAKVESDKDKVTYNSSMSAQWAATYLTNDSTKVSLTNSSESIDKVNKGHFFMELVILTLLKGQQDKFALSTNYADYLKQVSVALTPDLRAKLKTLFRSELGDQVDVLDDIKASDAASSLTAGDFLKKVNYHLGDPVGYLFVREMKIVQDDPKYFVFTLMTMAGPIQFQFPKDFATKALPNLEDFSTNSDYRFNFIDISKDDQGNNAILAQMDAMAIVPGTAGKTFIYSSERIPNIVAQDLIDSGQYNAVDGSVYERAPVYEVTCREERALHANNSK